MKELTSNLLYLTEIDHTGSHILYVPFNLSETVESIVLTMEAVIFEKNISLHYDIEPDLNIYGNKEQMKQVVMILLDNAIKYTDYKGFITLHLFKNKINILFYLSPTQVMVFHQNI